MNAIRFTGKDGILHLGGVLLAICLIVAAALGYVNAVTADRIADAGEQKLQESLREIVPDADRFDEIFVRHGEEDAVSRAFEIIKDGVYAGLCVLVAPTGFAGPIDMIVGVGSDGAVLGVRVVSMSETAGLGAKVNIPDWLSQFEGLSAPFNLVKTAAAEGDIAAVSGATLSSRAIVQGVTAAVNFAKTYTPEVIG